MNDLFDRASATRMEYREIVKIKGLLQSYAHCFQIKHQCQRVDTDI